MPTKIRIIPSEGGDSDWLHNMAVKMNVENPAIAFTAAAKEGPLNEYDDDQYDKLLQVIKRLNLLLFVPPESDKPEASINIYDVSISIILLREILLPNLP